MAVKYERVKHTNWFRMYRVEPGRRRVHTCPVCLLPMGRPAGETCVFCWLDVHWDCRRDIYASSTERPGLFARKQDRPVLVPRCLECEREQEEGD